MPHGVKFNEEPDDTECISRMACMNVTCKASATYIEVAAWSLAAPRTIIFPWRGKTHKERKAGILTMFWKRFLLAVALVLMVASVASARMVSVRGNKVDMRSGPGSGYSVLWELGRGYPLKVIGSKKGWVKVVDFENSAGWIARRLLCRVPHMVVKKKRINIRSGPSTRYRIVAKANYGVVFRTLAKRGRWVKVQHENGLVGWTERRLLWGW